MNAWRRLCNVPSRHLWYLGEEMMGLSFFDDQVSPEIKRKFVKSLREKTASQDRYSGNGVKINVGDMENAHILKLDLDDLVTQGTQSFFDILSLPTDFLQVSRDFV